MTINGHFWITDEKTGETIYDPLFKHTEWLAKVHRANVKKPIYEPAPAERQREAIRDYVAEFFCVTMKHLDDAPHEFWEPKYLQCAINVAKYKAKGNKGKITYGNIGYERKDGSIWYQFADDQDEAEATALNEAGFKEWEKTLDKKEKKKNRHYYEKHEKKLEEAIIRTRFQFYRWGIKL